MEALLKLPSTIAAGTTVKYTRTHSDYPADQGWTLKLHLRGAQTRDYTAVAVGASFSFTLPATGATGTATLPAGDYTWEERAEKAGEVFRPPGARGTVRVTPDLSTAAAGALQSQAEKDLAVVEAKIAGRLSADLEEYEIAGRAVKKIPIRELYRIRNTLRAEVRALRKKGQFETPIRSVLGSGR